jgi:hypothetical protein
MFVCLTKKYKYYQCQHLSILKNVWGEIIRKIEVVLVLAMAMLSVPVLAQVPEAGYGLAGSGGVDVLGTGIFETDGSLIKFPELQNTNIDTLDVGNDKALAFGNIWQKTPIASATNNLEIKKNQESGDDTYILVNIDQIKVGNREAMAFGFAAATNNVKIVANQQ